MPYIFNFPLCKNLAIIKALNQIPLFSKYGQLSTTRIKEMFLTSSHTYTKLTNEVKHGI